MNKISLLLITKLCVVLSIKESLLVKEINQDSHPVQSEKVLYQYIAPVGPYTDTINNEDNKHDAYKSYAPASFPYLHHQHHHEAPKTDLNTLINGNPLLSALLLSHSLGLPIKSYAPNHPELLPINPFIALLLSQYGRYVPHHGAGRGLYGYTAASNYHNNKPFGSYKIYEDE